jgi:hypothetical protein
VEGKACGTCGEVGNAYRIFMGKPEGIRPIGRLGGRWENIKMDLKETGWEGMNWIDLAQDRDNSWAIVKLAVNLQVPKV